MPPPSPPPRPPPELIDDAVTEILLRLPSGDPACLARAGLVCRRWRRVLSDPAFRRRYRAFHGPPPLLGFLLNREFRDCRPRFVATAAASPFSAPALEGRGRWSWEALDCRHGRALFYSPDSGALLVWDPATGGQQQTIRPDYPCEAFAAAVLCTAAGCDHLDCHGGPFNVVFVGVYNNTWAILYSSETREWTSPAYLGIECNPTMSNPARLVGDVLYFVVDEGMVVLKYDLAVRRLSLIDAPDEFDWACMLITAEGGRLGCAIVDNCNYNLFLWSLQAGAGGEGVEEEWVQDRIIDLVNMLQPFPALPVSPALLGFAEGTDTIFINTNVGAIAIDLRSGQMKKVGKSGRYYSILPYMSYYTPV
ncbi:hypothetical protein ACP4OV_012094 [Aristida adscensionis]